ncbi:hypothetical protein NL676_021151 [Syzygium grande]|nr:hypothetical protein NL676_021151 [Syzygium grande]
MSNRSPLMLTADRPLSEEIVPQLNVVDECCGSVTRGIERRGNISCQNKAAASPGGKWRITSHGKEAKNVGVGGGSGRPSSLVDQDKIATFEHPGAVYTKDQKRAFCPISIDRAPTLPSKT